jgi:hypothetical protein
MYSKSSIYLSIIIAFLASAILSYHYISKYDRLKTSTNNNLEHAMIKSAIGNHWVEADRILKDIKSGKSYFASGTERYDEFLPPRLLALYYYVAGYEIFDSDMNIKRNNGKLPYLIIKTFLYYLALFYLCKKIFTIFPLKNCFFIILFLALEPSIFQYHSSFWNESLFFSFEILLLSLLLDQSRNILKNIFIGFILGILFTISQEIFLYIVPLLLYYFILFKKKSIKPILGLVIGYLIIFIIIGFHNYKRIGMAYFMPDGSKTALYIYLAPQVLAKKNNSSVEQARKKMKEQTKMWIEKNNIDVTQKTTSFTRVISESTEDKKKYHDYLQKKALKIIVVNPFTSIKRVFKLSLHTLVLNPVYIKYFYQFEGRGGVYNKSETHKKWIPIRIIYSVIIYLVIFLGMIYSLKHMKKEIIFLLIISVAYIIASLSWMGIPRYFVPALIFLSIFFGNGMAAILNSNKLNISK